MHNTNGKPLLSFHHKHSSQISLYLPGTWQEGCLTGCEWIKRYIKGKVSHFSVRDWNQLFMFTFIFLNMLWNADFINQKLDYLKSQKNNIAIMNSVLSHTLTKFVLLCSLQNDVTSWCMSLRNFKGILHTQTACKLHWEHTKTSKIIKN